MAIQREIEMLGLPTVLITLRPKASAEQGPPRAIHPDGFMLGDPLGLPNRPDLQREVLLAALRRWEAREEPGVIPDIEFPAYVRDPEIENDGEIIRGHGDEP